MVLRILLPFLFLFPVIVLSQTNENFSDGNFRYNPVWKGDTTKFIINPSLQLQLNGLPLTDTACLYIDNKKINNTEWDLWIKLAFSGSSSNYIKIYLASDTSNFKKSLNGYYLRIGETGSQDGVDLYRQDGNSSIKLIDGINKRAALSQNTIRIKVTRDNIGNWTLYSDTTGGSNYQLEGTCSDFKYNFSKYFGFYCKHTSTNKAKFFMDDIEIKLFSTDFTAPVLDSAIVKDSNKLELKFSEPLDESSAEQIDNYFVNNGIGNPIYAEWNFNFPSKVLLTFSNNFQDGIENRLDVINVMDESLNLIETGALKFFTYKAPVIGKKGDIIITEIYADPSPTIDLPAVEFIEIYSKKNKALSLENWKFTDGSSETIFKNHSINPGEYIIVCPIGDTSIYKSFGRVIGLNSFPTLNNSSDQLQLLNDSLIVIDQVNYTDNWYKDDVKKTGGWSLERINLIDTPCVMANNWKASLDNKGGTPGMQNSIFNNTAGNDPPVINSIAIINTTTIKVVMSKAIEYSSALLKENYNIQPGNYRPSSINLSALLDSISLNLPEALESGINYSLSINNLKDCKGNSISSTAIFSLPHKGNLKDILINEIFADPDPVNGLPEYEFIELFNNSDRSIDLEGWTFSDAGLPKEIPKCLLNPGEYLILCASAAENLYKSFGKGISLSSFPALNNDGDSLFLFNSENTLIDKVFYNSSWYKDDNKAEGGWTLERIDPNYSCESSLNWKASENTTGGTPGTINSVQQILNDTQDFFLSKVIVINSKQIKLVFNKPLETNTTLLSDQFDIQPSPGNIDSIKYYDNIVEISISEELKEGTVYFIRTENFRDCSGNQVDNSKEFKTGLPQETVPGNIVINEILFNPKPGNVDFIELYNNSSKIVDLKDLKIGNSPDLNTLKEIIPEGLLFFPKEYLLISSDIKLTRQEYFVRDTNTMLEITSMPSFNDDLGEIILSSKQVLIDRFQYSEKMQFPLLNEPEGVSLERINPSLPTQISSNWHSAAESVGFATPGYQNSQFQESGKKNDEITLAPELFSPDNDGNNDVINVHYKFSEPGFLANVKIFDTKGLMVKHLVKNELIGVEGTFCWDGINERLEKSRIGIYVIFIEMIDIKGSIKTYKKSCVLGGKLE